MSIQFCRGPVAKMVIQRNKDSIRLCTVLEDLQVIGTSQTHFGGALDIMAELLAGLNYTKAYHLIQENLHGGAYAAFDSISVWSIIEWQYRSASATCSLVRLGY